MSAGVAATTPLAGRVVVVTRAREQAEALSRLLEEAGGTVLAVPTIVIEPPASWIPLDQALGSLPGYAWVVFTSVNGVAMVRRRLEARGLGVSAMAGRRVAAIGPATADALRHWGCQVEVTPTEYVAEALADRLRPRLAPGERVLLPRAAEARDVLVRELTGAGALVDEVAAYRTRPATEEAPALRRALGAGRVDALTFTSSSTVRNFAALFRPGELPRLTAGVVVAVIGPITRATAAGIGLAADVMPAEYTIPALGRAIIAHFESRRS